MQFLPRDPYEIQSLLCGKTFRIDDKGDLITFTKDVLLTESGAPTPYTVSADEAGTFTFHAPGYTGRSRLKLIKFITRGCTLLFLAWQLVNKGKTWSLTEVPEAGLSFALSYHMSQPSGSAGEGAV